MVSPYLLRPLRSLEEVLKSARIQGSRREPVPRAPIAQRGPETTAAVLRRQGRIVRPRIVWDNGARGSSAMSNRETDSGKRDKDDKD